MSDTTETPTADETAAVVVDTEAPEGDATEQGDLSEQSGLSEQDVIDEGDAAADYIEELLDIADIDGDLTLDVKQGRAYVSVEAEDDALRLISAPDTVQALQELTRIAVQTQTGRFSGLILDVGGSRDARQRQLEKLVDRAIARLDEGASQASLPAMSSYERKLIHDIVADRGLVSESYGEGADRHTVIRRA